MIWRRASNLCIGLLFCCGLLTACAQTSNAPVAPTRTPNSVIAHNASPTVPPVPVNTPKTVLARYTSRVVLSGSFRPDDLAFDPTGHLVFSDVFHGTVDRLNANGSVTVLLRGLNEPEGLVFLSDGTLIIAEQQTNRILSLAPSATIPRVLRVLPGVPSRAACKEGVDGIALDATTQTLIVPDSPAGNVYRMSLDGKTLTLLTAHIARPVGAAVDAKGNIYVADECGGAVWKIPPTGALTRLGNFGAPDDIAFDPQGNVLVTDLQASVHSLIRVDLATGQRDVLAREGFIEPQGLVVDTSGNIYLSDDAANKIVKYSPIGV